MSEREETRDEYLDREEQHEREQDAREIAFLRAEVERLRLGNIRLRSVAESATEVPCARTGSISHRCGECRACMVRVRASAALAAPAEEEGRDA